MFCLLWKAKKQTKHYTVRQSAFGFTCKNTQKYLTTYLANLSNCPKYLGYLKKSLIGCPYSVREMDGQDDFFRFTSQVMPQHVICWIYYVSRDFSFFRLRAATDSLIKGQLISKCFFGAFTFIQKMNEKKSQVVKSNLFILFLEETSSWKKYFEFVWPLACNVIIFTFFVKINLSAVFSALGPLFTAFQPLSPPCPHRSQFPL